MSVEEEEQRNRFVTGVPLQAKLHYFVTLALQIGFWEVDLGLAVRNAHNRGEFIDTTFSVSLEAAWERIRIHGVDTGAIIIKLAL